MPVLHRWVIPFTTAYTTTSASEVAFPVGPYERVRPSTTASGRGWLEFRAELGSANVGVGVQVTNDVRATPTSTRFSALATADGVSDPTGTPVAIDLDGVKYIRPVVFPKSGDGALCGGAISGVVEIWE